MNSGSDLGEHSPESHGSLRSLTSRCCTTCHREAAKLARVGGDDGVARDVEDVWIGTGGFADEYVYPVPTERLIRRDVVTER